MNPDIQNAGERVADLADEIKRLFKPPMHVTVLVRMPEFPDGSRDFILTDDTLDKAEEAIRLRQTQPSIVGAV